ncbi:subtilisin-like protein [Neocallimastix lanati (nom. inval.)]|nr:subtilisin-like protein [Neocallimastix sp. JGI-2020a]
MNDIYDVIEKKKESYILENSELDKKLDELESLPKEKRNEQRKKFLFLNKQNNRFYKRSLELNKSDNSTSSDYIPFESNLVMHITDVLNYKLVSAYLSEETAKIVCNMKNVLYCKKNEKLNIIGNAQMDTPVEVKLNLNKRSEENFSKYDETKYYNIEAIQRETGWKEVSVQEFSNVSNFNYLQLISQSPYYYECKRIDNNYYYPSSAGQGIDIYAIDGGLIVDHIDFDTYEGTPYERTVTCDALATETGINETTEEQKNNCTYKEGYYPGHGIMDLSVAGGKYSGVAKKSQFTHDYLDHAIPHKTVVNLSLRWPYYLDLVNGMLKSLNKKGIVIIDAAGNENRNICESKENPNFESFSGYRKSITVGGITTDINENGYFKTYNSNYGDCVDIFANFTDGSGESFIETGGTSCSAPIVVGIAALIMSEFPDNYTTETMKEKLLQLSFKDTINNLGYSKTFNTPNYFVNNGKRSIYSPDDTNVVVKDGCCSKEGECISFENDPWEKCLIENGCQSEFGYCTTVEKAIEECEKEVKENEECQFEFKNMKNSEILSKGETFKSDKCQTFYKRQFANQSVCSIAKKYKSFGFIDNYNKTTYLNSTLRYNNVRLKDIIDTYMECHQDSIPDNINEKELEKKCKIINSNKCKQLPYVIYEENKRYSVLMDPIHKNYTNNKKKCSKGCFHPSGYPCCLKTKEVVTTDVSGNWGYENKDFCFICWSISLGYPCCMKTNNVVYVDKDGQWGAEDGHWCGIPN